MLLKQPFTFDRVARLLITTTAVVVFVILIDVLRDVLLPFLVGWLIAYILEPVVQYNRAMLHLRGRAIAVFVTLFEITTLLCIIGYFMVPSIVTEIFSGRRTAQGVCHERRKHPVPPCRTPLFPARQHQLRGDRLAVHKSGL